MSSFDAVAQHVDKGFPYIAIPNVQYCCNMTCRQKYAIPPYSYSKSNRQVALVLLHSDWANTNAEPLAPHIVSVGALSAAPAKALPSDLEEFMQSAGEHGVVFASLGTTAIPGLLLCSNELVDLLRLLRLLTYFMSGCGTSQGEDGNQNSHKNSCHSSHQITLTQ